MSTRQRTYDLRGRRIGFRLHSVFLALRVLDGNQVEVVLQLRVVFLQILHELPITSTFYPYLLYRDALHLSVFEVSFLQAGVVGHQQCVETQALNVTLTRLSSTLKCSLKYCTAATTRRSL